MQAESEAISVGVKDT